MGDRLNANNKLVRLLRPERSEIFHHESPKENWKALACSPRPSLSVSRVTLRRHFDMGRLMGYKNCDRSQNQVRRSGDSISDKYNGLRSKGLNMVYRKISYKKWGE